MGLNKKRCQNKAIYQRQIGILYCESLVHQKIVAVLYIVRPQRYRYGKTIN